MSDTPRTDAHNWNEGHYDDPLHSLLDFAKQLERELNAANTEIEEKRKDVVWLATEKAKLENYVMLLEESGDAMADLLDGGVFMKLAVQWHEAKEVKL